MSHNKYIFFHQVFPESAPRQADAPKIVGMIVISSESRQRLWTKTYGKWSSQIVVSAEFRGYQIKDLKWKETISLLPRKIRDTLTSSFNLRFL